MLRFLLGISLLLFPLLGNAGANECSYPFAPNTFPFSTPVTGEEDYLANFKGFSNLLFLSEGAYPIHVKKVARNMPRAKIIAADIDVMTEQQRAEFRMNLVPNMDQVYVDNSKRLPFADGFFDLVFMQKGLCHCNCASTSCGGIQRSFSARRDFLSEVMRVLDKNNPKTIAFLHGMHGITEDDIREYQDAFASIPDSRHFVLDVLRLPYNGVFRGFRLRTQNSQP